MPLNPDKAELDLLACFFLAPRPCPTASFPYLLIGAKKYPLKIRMKRIKRETIEGGLRENRHHGWLLLAPNSWYGKTVSCTNLCRVMT